MLRLQKLVYSQQAIIIALGNDKTLPGCHSCKVQYALLVSYTTTTYEFVSVTARAGGSAIAHRPRSTYLSWTGLPMARSMARWPRSSGDGPTYGLKGGPAIRREAPSNAKSSRHSAIPHQSSSGDPSFFFSLFELPHFWHFQLVCSFSSGAWTLSAPILPVPLLSVLSALIWSSFSFSCSLLLVNGLRVSNACFSSSSRAKRWIELFF